MARVVEENTIKINEIEVEILVLELEEGNEKFYSKGRIISLDIDNDDFHYTPSELIKLGKLLIREGKYIQRNYGHFGRKKEVSNG